MQIRLEDNRIIMHSVTQELTIEPWGENSLRVRMIDVSELDDRDFALTEPVPALIPEISDTEIDMTEPWYRGPEWERYHTTGHIYTIRNGKIKAIVSPEGWISYYRAGEEGAASNKQSEAGSASTPSEFFVDSSGSSETFIDPPAPAAVHPPIAPELATALPNYAAPGDRLLLSEYWRNRNRVSRYSVPIGVPARQMKPIPGSPAFELFARFEAQEGEHIFGMGQYQMAQFDKKGSILELEHRNSQASVPFYVSSLGYGFLWNNPGVGTVTFGENKTEWHLNNTKKMDYWITAGDTPAEIEYQYSEITGRTPMMPEFGMGFWQCKLRYRTQEEVLEVAREHKRRGLPMDVIVVDFFHWTLQGNYEFDPECFPDPEAMVKELRELGIETVVSIWPTVDERSRNFGKMNDQGFLMRVDRGHALSGSGWMGATVYYDATNPGARKFVWEECKKNYYSKGVHIFWLDEAEPEVGPYEFDNLRYFAGPAEQVTNLYPKEYARGFYEGLVESGEKDIMSLVRCAWAGSQKYGALTWSGDIHSSWRGFREQVQAGLSMGIAGIPWWTCDLGGFIGGDPTDEGFRELMARWFAWGCFLPVFRLHGERSPWYVKEVTYKENGRQVLSSGQPNEVWSYGERNYEIMTKYLFLREQLRPYVRRIMKAASETGEPVIRPLFFDFPDDPGAWQDNAKAHMFGPDILVSPVTAPGVYSWPVYLPEGANWIESATGRVFAGGQTVEAEAPLDIIPVFIRQGSGVSVY